MSEHLHQNVVNYIFFRFQKNIYFTLWNKMNLLNFKNYNNSAMAFGTLCSLKNWEMFFNIWITFFPEMVSAKLYFSSENHFWAQMKDYHPGGHLAILCCSRFCFWQEKYISEFERFLTFSCHPCRQLLCHIILIMIIVVIMWVSLWL